MSYPNSVPVLTEDDMIKGKLDSNSGEKHCLIGWLYEIGFDDFDVELNNVMKEQLIQNNLDSTLDIHAVDVAKFNDSKYHSKKLLANTWNSIMKKLGYTEIEDA